MNSQAKKISVIVPVYNVESYVRKTIESILTQSHRDLELILVNDGSVDRSGAICDDYANKDNRVRVFHKENSGSSDARNMGLDNAKGEYILFVDADDYISSDMLEVMVGLMSQQVDVVVCDFVSVTGDVDMKGLAHPEKPSLRTISSTAALEDMMYQRFITNSPWAKLYRSSLFEGVRFPSGKINQDLGTIYKAIAKANNVSLVDQKMYMYMYRPDSVINSKFSAKRMAGLQFANEQYDFIKSHFPDIEKAATNRLFMEGVFILQKMGINGVIAHKKEYRECENTIKRTRGVVRGDSNSSQRYKVFALISYIHPSLLAVSGDLIRFVKRLERATEGWRR